MIFHKNFSILQINSTLQNHFYPNNSLKIEFFHLNSRISKYKPHLFVPTESEGPRRNIRNIFLLREKGLEHVCSQLTLGRDDNIHHPRINQGRTGLDNLRLFLSVLDKLRNLSSFRLSRGCFSRFSGFSEKGVLGSNKFPRYLVFPMASLSYRFLAFRRDICSID